MPKVVFVKEKKEIEVAQGANLREEARKAGVEVYQGLTRYLNCRGLGPKPGSAWVFGRNSPSDQPSGGHDNSERPSHPTPKSIPGECALEEHRNESCAFTAERD